MLPWAEFAGEQVTLHNIRNCDYRTETNFVVRHYDKTYDLSKLRTLDFYLVHWGSPWIGHTMLSFVFDGGDCLAVSVEIRPQDFSDRMRQMQALKERIDKEIHSVAGIRVHVKLVDPQTLERSMGKAVRVIDRRPPL